MVPVSAAGEVDAGDAQTGREKLLSQPLPGEGAQFGRDVGVGDPELFLKKVADLLSGHVQGGRNDVGGGFAGQLNNELAQIGLHGFHPGGLQRIGQPDLLGSHGLGFHHRGGSQPAAEIHHVAGGLAGVTGPEHPAATLDHAGFQPLQMEVQMLDGFFLDAMGPFSEIFPLRHQLDGLCALFQGMVGGRVKRSAKTRVGHILRGKDLELAGRTVHPFQRFSPRRSARWSGLMGRPRRLR